MFLGEFLCLLVFKFVWFSTAQYRIERMTYQGDASSPIARHWPIKIRRDIHLVEGEQAFNPFIFWIPSICDMLSTCLSYVALNYTTASSFQMLRGSVMVFTAILRYTIADRLWMKCWSQSESMMMFQCSIFTQETLVGALVGYSHCSLWSGRGGCLRYCLFQNTWRKSYQCGEDCWGCSNSCWHAIH